MEKQLNEAAGLIKKARYGVAFTGAGISVESGIPPFRGPDGLWNKINPEFIEINYYKQNPQKSWQLINRQLLQFLKTAEPNQAHKVLAGMESAGLIKSVITQNIDYLHQTAGSRHVIEFHGTINTVKCLECGMVMKADYNAWQQQLPACSACQGLLKPDFVFFNEAIAQETFRAAMEQADKADVMLIIGTSGEIVPAAMIPRDVKRRNNTTIIEINREPSNYTGSITDLFLQGQAGELMLALEQKIKRG